MGKLPAPVSPVTGKPAWERGIRLHGGQRRLLVDPYRWKQAAGGIRGGKSWVGGGAIFVDAVWRSQVRGIKDDLYGIIGDSYKMAEEEMRHIARLFDGAGIPYELRTPEQQSWKMTFHHTKQEIVTLTASDVTKIASRPYRGLVIAEAAQVDYEAVQNAEDRVSERRGWVLSEGTFENRKGPWYNQQAVAWSQPNARGRFYALPSWENLLVYPGGREDPEILAAENRMTRERFLERYGGEPMKRSDLVMRYADRRWQIKRRFPAFHTSYDRDLPVYLFCDPGISHAYAVIAVQFIENVTWVIDVVYRWGRNVKQMVDECARKPWAHRVEAAVMDVAAHQRRAEGDPIMVQWPRLWREATGLHLHCIAQPVPLEAGYDIHNVALLNAWPEPQAQEYFNADKKLRQVTDPEGPRLMFDPDASAALFGGDVDDQEYDGEYNLHRHRKNREGTITSSLPIDADNDAIKAINYGLYWRYGPDGLKQKFSRFMPAGSTMPFEVSV